MPPKDTSAKSAKAKNVSKDESEQSEPRRSKRQASQKSEEKSVPKDDRETNTEKATTGVKRKKSSGDGPSKKVKPGKKVNENSKNTDGTFGSKHMSSDEPAPRGSNNRLPEKGQKAFWKAMPGIVDGTVEEVLKKGKNVAGKQVKASEDDPKIILKSAKSGKICVHKPDACFYD